jgi:SacI homology domain
VVAINLLSLKKEEEKNLTVFFEGLVNAYGKETSAVGYRFFDFHQECKSDNFSKT